MKVVEPTALMRDADLAVERHRAARVAHPLTSAGMQPSEAEGERVELGFRARVMVADGARYGLFDSVKLKCLKVRSGRGKRGGRQASARRGEQPRRTAGLPAAWHGGVLLSILTVCV